MCFTSSSVKIQKTHNANYFNNKIYFNNREYKNIYVSPKIS